jgi:glycosyltransferase involved in cell wall biosynthesis
MLIFGRSCLPFWTIMVSRFLGKRVVYRMTLLSSDDPAAIKGRGWLAWLRFRLLSQAAAFVATSTPLVESYRRCQLPESKLHLIPNGVDTERFVGPLPLTEKKALRRDLRIAPDAQVLAFVGMLYRRKGIDILLQTFQKLLTEREDLVLLLVGPEAPSPGHPTFLEGLAESNHTHTLDGRVIHTGQQEAIERYLRAADVFVFPSRREGFPSAVIEAMSCGLPVVISQMDGIAQDIITPGLDGYIVNELTPIAFSKAITPLLDEPTLRTRIGQNARQTVCQRFSIERMVSRYAALIESLVGHPVDGGRM